MSEYKEIDGTRFYKSRFSDDRLIIWSTDYKWERQEDGSLGVTFEIRQEPNPYYKEKK